MNTQEYISSGIVESYVLGLASEEERREFEQMCGQYAEVKAAREAFELMLEREAMANAVPPPAGLKNKLWSQINFSVQITNTAEIKDQKPPLLVKMGWLRYAVAACLVLLAGSLYWNLSLQTENKRIKESLSSAQKNLEAAKDTISGMKAGVSTIAGRWSDIKMVGLKGMPEFPQSFATVYWDTASKDVYLMVNNLPKPASGQQYQLWALLNGEPIDMGVLTISEKPLQLYRMKNVQHAQAFAITLEKKGGSPAPQGKMYAMGGL